MARYMSEATRAYIVTLTLEGHSAEMIGKVLGVSARTVQRVRKEKQVARPVPPRFSDAERRRAEQLLDDGASWEETARTIGRAPRTIRKAFPGRGWTRAQCDEFISLRRRFRQVWM